MKDYYYILGVDINSTLDEVKDAYRKLSKKLHPDLNQGDKYFEARFRDVKDAFETLRDPVKRSQYNQDLKRARTNPLNRRAKRALSLTVALVIKRVHPQHTGQNEVGRVLA